MPATFGENGFLLANSFYLDAIQERSAAFVIFKTRYAAVIATQMLQSPNPMSWVTELAPEPHDVLWSNLCIPFRQLWLRKIVTLLASVVFMVLFLAPVTFVQGLTQLQKLSQTFPFLRGFLKQLVLYCNNDCAGGLFLFFTPVLSPPSMFHVLDFFVVNMVLYDHSRV